MIALGAIAASAGALAASDLFGSGSSGALSAKSAALARIDEFQNRARRDHPGWRREKGQFRLRQRFMVLPRPPEGIVEGAVPFPSSIYILDGARIRSHWHAPVLTTVYTGVLTEQRSQGIVIVLTRPWPRRVSLVPKKSHLTAPDPSRADLYLTPVRAGFVQIAGYRGDVLTLVAARGHLKMTFDVSSRTFRTS